MAEVGESKTEIRETKTRVRARRRENEKGIIRTKKEAKGERLRKFFEPVDGSFQELGF